MGWAIQDGVKGRWVDGEVDECGLVWIGFSDGKRNL